MLNGGEGDNSGEVGLSGVSFFKGMGLEMLLASTNTTEKARDSTCSAKSPLLSLWSYLAAARTGECALAAGGEHADAESLSMTMTSSDDELLGRLRLSRLVEGGSIAARANGARS